MTDATTQNESVFWRMVSALWFSAASARAWTYRSGLRRQQRLRAPVISIGNLSFGGTGKTPFTIWLAGKLGEHGYRAAVLTRGYRRASKGVRIHPPGSSWLSAGDGPNLAHSPAHDGDEVQLYLRHLPQAAVGIAPHRYNAGQLIEAQLPVDVHLLDDGFQHLPLARALDIVLIDASNPWGAPSWGPNAGLTRALREPPLALRRADCLLLTRCDQIAPTTLTALEAELRDIYAGHAAAAIHHAETRLTGFRVRLDESAVPASSLAGKRVAAFCGVGNPDSFFAMLRASGIAPVATRVFPDHHHYNDQDVDQLNELLRNHRAEALITTEKDVVNLPNAAQFAGNFIAPAYWAEINMAIREEDELLRIILEKIGPPAPRSAPDSERY